MKNYQSLFDGIAFLLEKNKENNALAKQCLKDCEQELAFTPPQKNITVAKSVLLEIYKRTDEKALAQVSASFNESPTSEVLVWYLDTESGSYSIFTDKTCKELVGIKTSAKTLLEIRNSFFNQQSILEKLGDKPLFDYDKNEITFINKKLVE